VVFQNQQHLIILHLNRLSQRTVENQSRENFTDRERARTSRKPTLQ
jgi:hypothetical protein